ncbi:MAG: PqqD family protein [Longimicrobiales bacterium]
MIGLRKRGVATADVLMPGARLRARPTVVAAERDGRTVLLDLRTDRYYGLDETGSRFWALLSEGRTTDETAALLAAEYDAPAERLKADATAFALRLAAAGLLEAE